MTKSGEEYFGGIKYLESTMPSSNSQTERNGKEKYKDFVFLAEVNGKFAAEYVNVLHISCGEKLTKLRSYKHEIQQQDCNKLFRRLSNALLLLKSLQRFCLYCAARKRDENCAKNNSADNYTNTPAFSACALSTLGVLDFLVQVRYATLSAFSTATASPLMPSTLNDFPPAVD